MASDLYYPGLTVEGWTNRSVTLADLLLSDFFLCEKSQTFNFPEDVASFPYICRHYQGKVSEICYQTQNTLASYLGKFFERVDIEVTSKAESESSSSYALYIYLQVTDSEGEIVSLNRMLTNENNTISSLMAIATGN